MQIQCILIHRQRLRPALARSPARPVVLFIHPFEALAAAAPVDGATLVFFLVGW